MTAFVKVGSIFLRTGNKVIAPPPAGSLVVLRGGLSGAGTYLAGTIPPLGFAYKSLAFLMRVRADELVTAWSPGGIGTVAFGVIGSAFELAAGGSAGTFNLSSTFPAAGTVGTGPEAGLSPHSIAVLPAIGGFVWVYAHIDYTVGGGNYEGEFDLFDDAHTQLAGATRTATYGSGLATTDPAVTGISIANYANAPFATTPGGLVIDGFYLLGSTVDGSAVRAGNARSSLVADSDPRLLITYGFSNVLTPDQPISAPLVPTSLVTPSATFIPGGIIN